jgi:hypothetical protein
MGIARVSLEKACWCFATVRSAGQQSGHWRFAGLVSDRRTRLRTRGSEAAIRAVLRGTASDRRTQARTRGVLEGASIGRTTEAKGAMVWAALELPASWT